jgi:hypothetical protein
MPSQTQLEVTIGGRWIGLECLYGDVEQSTVWPGGSDELSWALGTQPAHRFTGGELVVGYYGPLPVWAGSLLEPDPSQDRVIAQGAWREADEYAALDGSGNATTIPNTAVDQAIIRTLAWTRPTTISGSAVDLDVSQGPVMVGALLDSWSEQSGQRWGVNPGREVVTKADDTTPTFQTLPLDGGLGYTRDTYASTLVGRYYNGATYATTTRTDSVAEAAHGHMEAIVDLTPRGTLTLAKANTILDNLLALGRAIPSWTTGIQLTYGELLTDTGVPVALETVAAGTILRIPGGFELAQRLNGQMYLDVPIGRTQLAGGVLTIQPADVAVRSLTDLFTAALTRNGGH